MTRDDLKMIRYFWEEKEDIERYVGYEEILPDLERDYPAIVKAWKDYKASRDILSAVIRDICEE